MKKILVVGITPPPYGGQAMMTERLIKTEFEGLKIYHVRMSFSKSMSSVGKCEFGKIVQMFSVVAKAVFYRYRYNISTLYYMPGGLNRNPVIRDIFILFFLRLFFRKTIFHFRAAGLSELVERLPCPLKMAAKAVYDKPNLAIHLSSLNPDDGRYFHSRKIVVIPNGMEDAALPFLPICRVMQKQVNILYVGIIQESKGAMVLVKAIKLLLDRGYKIHLNMVGEFASCRFMERMLKYCNEKGLEACVSFPGVKTGEQKWQYYLKADIFCLPSFFEAESFGNVFVEAMMFELPVVATSWRGIPSVVTDGVTGILSPVHNVKEITNALEALIQHNSMRIELGRRGREKYLREFSFEMYLKIMQHYLCSV